MSTAPVEASAPARPFHSSRWWGLLALTYALAAVAGAAADWAGFPLPWMLGPFFAFAAMSAAGAEFALIPMGRELGQVAIGTAVGLRFTPEVLVATVTLLPAMAVATVYVILYTLAAAFLFRPMARVDGVTGFFATAAGGVADMALVAQRFGGEPGPVAVVHAMRVSMVVAVVPFLVVAFGETGAASDPAALALDALLLAPVALGLGYLAARLLKPTPLPNPWLVGPIFAGILIGATGVLAVSVPWPVIVVAQVMLGTWLGCQFRRSLLTALPRVTVAALAIAAFMIVCAAVGALVLSAATGLPFTTSFLSLAPAAVTEMVLTAQVMHLEAEIVTAFHVMRIAIVSSTVLLVFRLYNRLRGEANGPAL
jgi:membrane AbrB-like protein